LNVLFDERLEEPRTDRIEDEEILGNQGDGTGFSPFSADGDSVPDSKQRRLVASPSVSSNGRPLSFSGKID
jgi:hypothetical protein